MNSHDFYDEDDNYLPERFEAALGTHGALMACPACGKREWYTPEDGLVRIPGRVSESGVEGGVKMSLECAPLVCGNCDFVRFHLLGLPLG